MRKASLNLLRSAGLTWVLLPLQHILIDVDRCRMTSAGSCLLILFTLVLVLSNLTCTYCQSFPPKKAQSLLVTRQRWHNIHLDHDRKACLQLFDLSYSHKIIAHLTPVEAYRPPGPMSSSHHHFVQFSFKEGGQHEVQV